MLFAILLIPNLQITTSIENDLSRFLKAQENVYEQALSEVKTGRKYNHWMWYIFPQYKNLGYSSTSKFYAIQSLQEAQEYLNHEILGTRLREITNEFILSNETDARRIFGSTDSLKLKSSMTLFSLADFSIESSFKKVLDKYFNGQLDNKTIRLIKE